jgi:hypothetical protein
MPEPFKPFFQFGATKTIGDPLLSIAAARIERDNLVSKRQVTMFLILALVLVLLWLGGFTLFHVSGFLIHILLIFAVISIVMHFISGGRRA